MKRLPGTTMPNDIRLDAFVDGVAVVATAHTRILTEEKVNPVRIDKVSSWMSSNSVNIAPHKTETALLTRKWTHDYPVVLIDDHQIQLQKSVRYFGDRHLPNISRRQPAHLHLLMWP